MAPTGMATAHEECALTLPQQTTVSRANPATETARNNFDNFVMVQFISVDDSFIEPRQDDAPDFEWLPAFWPTHVIICAETCEAPPRQPKNVLTWAKEGWWVGAALPIFSANENN